jgi:hypothetical protein
VWFAEPAHPYDDPKDPGAWAWRVGYFELLYTPGIKTLTLHRGPKYSIRSGKSCRTCHGSGYLPWWNRSAEERAADTTSPRCPTCPARRTLFENLPLCPVGTIDRLATRRRLRRRANARHDNPKHDTPWDAPGQNTTGGYSDEPPF